MKNIIYILTFLSFGQPCYGQEKSFYVPTYGNGDTTLWFKWQQEKFEKAGLKNLTKTTDTLHFRFSSEIQAIDIWTMDYLTFSGTLTNYTTGRTTNKSRENKSEFFSNTKSIDTSTARQIYEIFKEESIFQILPQDSIKDWSNGEDGITYFIERSTKYSYSFKEYWTPSVFIDKVNDAKRFHLMTLKLEELLSLDESFDQFINSLPPGKYSTGGMTAITKFKKKRKPCR